MKIHEYQAKELLKRFGVPTPSGKMVTSAEDAMEAAKGLGNPPYDRQQLEVGDGRALALCTDADEDLTVAREGQALTLATARHVGGPGHGLFVHVDALPGLARLRLAKATLSLVDRGLSITTTPALGPCLHGLVAHVGGAMVGPRLPDALVDRLGADVGERPLTVHRQPLPGGGAIILMYHSVADAPHARFVDPAWHMTPARFEAQLRWLKANRT